MWILLLVVAVGWATVATAALVVRHRLRRRLRPAPGVRPTAPLRWLVWPSPAAARHRRLRAAVAAAPPGPRRRASPTAVEELVVSLHVLAADLDRRLVAAARLPRPHRGARLRELDPELDRLVDTADRLGRLAERAAAVPGTDLAAELEDRLGALEAAVADLEAHDRRASGRAEVGPGSAHDVPPEPLAGRSPDPARSRRAGAA